jgi:hypothetical protein
VLFIGALACILGLNIGAAKGREQLAIGLLFGLGLLLRGCPRAIAIAASIFLDIFNVFLLLLELFGGSRE